MTDADLVLGILNPDGLGDADVPLDAAAARRSIDDAVAEPLGLDVAGAAAAIREVTDAKLASAIRVAAVKRGYDPREFSLMGFGGAGPMHACDVARELDIDEVVFPNNPGLLSAFGVLVADVRHESVRSVAGTVEAVPLGRVNDAVRSATRLHDERLAAENVPPDRREFHVSFEMRYAGQAHELNVPVERTVEPGVDLPSGTIREQVAAFEAKHDRRYGFTDENNPVELVNVRVTAIGRRPDPALSSDPSADDGPPDGGSPSRARVGTREVTVSGGDREAVPYYDWDLLGPGVELAGPAVVEMANSTVWLPPDYRAVIDRHRTIVATREGDR